MATRDLRDSRAGGLVVLGNQPGQLANCLFTFAHFIANALEYRYGLANPGFEKYADYFQTTQADLFARYPARPSRITPTPARRANLLHFVNTAQQRRWLKPFAPRLFRNLNIYHSHDVVNQSYDLADPQFAQLRHSTWALIVEGWLFRDFDSFVKHSAAIREFFTPAAVHQQHIANALAEAKHDCDVLVGIHIRQGDYAQWQGGKYYYDTATYAGLAHRAAAWWPGKRVKFLLCSNVAPDLSLFSGLHCALGPNHPLEDLYALAQCHYLMGPPSTYNMWASFYGEVPLYTIQDPTASFDLTNFTIRTK